MKNITLGVYFSVMMSMVMITTIPTGVSSLNPCSARKMYEAYNAMRRADCKNCDKYFHCIGNYNAVYQCSGWGQEFTARSISNAREWFGGTSSGDDEGDQLANQRGRQGANCASIYLAAANCAYKPHNGRCYW